VIECDTFFKERVLSMETYVVDALNLDWETWKASWKTRFAVCTCDVFSLEMVGKDRGHERESQAETTVCGVPSERKHELFEKLKKIVLIREEYRL